MIIVKAEICGGDIDGNIRIRQLGGDLVLHLLLFVFAIEVLIVLGRVIAGAVFELHIGTTDLHLDAAEASIHRRVVAAIAENVIRRCIVLHFRKDLVKVVGIEESLAAGICGERGQCLLRGGIGVELIKNRLSRVRRNTAQAGVAGQASGRHRFEATNVHRIDGHIRLHRGIGRSAQRGLILDTGTAHAIAEVDNRLLLLDPAQLVYERLQSLELAISVELVVVAIVSNVRATSIRSALGRSGLGAIRHALPFGRVVGMQLLGEQLLIGCEVLVNLKRAAE